jgi:outer membrane protein OmpA-like peptidoglycan-associated protein
MNKTQFAKLLFLIVACFQIFGCASTRQPTQAEIFNQFDSINQLDKVLFSAKESGVNNFAPAGFNKAKDLLNQSVQLAQEGKTDKAQVISAQGIEIIKKAQSDADVSKKEMWEVTEYRTKAISAGASDLYKTEFEDADKMFRKTAAYFETGDFQEGKESQPDLIEKYSKLERDALEKGVIELAKLSFEQAKNEDANKYAPKSFKRAQNELNVALSIIETDRTRTEKANEHAKIASVLAKNASQISALAKTFKRRDFSNEDIVLWYWQQLEKINEPFSDTVNFQQPNHIVIQDIQKKIAEMKASYEKFSMDTQIIEKKQQEYIETLNENHKMEIAELNSQLDQIKKKYKMEVTEQQKMLAEKERAEREIKQRFAYIQSLFNPGEAQVYRKGDNVLISAHGFYFPSGDDEIKSTNFGLLNKLLSSTKQFPNARIGIYGHTDSVGPGDLNLKLSEKRAENVANFIANVGHIPPTKIIHKGFGDTKPIASDKTKEGRTQNRRIEMVIINE